MTRLLHREFLFELSNIEDQVQLVLQAMVRHGTFTRVQGASDHPAPVLEHTLHEMVSPNSVAANDTSDMVQLAPSGEASHSFLCAMVWPFIEGYYMAAMALTAISPGQAMPRARLLERMQSLGSKLYQDKLISSFEGSSLEMLSNALDLYQEWNIIAVKNDAVVVLPPYNEEQPLRELGERLASFQRQRPHLDSTMSRALLVAELPVLSRL